LDTSLAHFSESGFIRIIIGINKSSILLAIKRYYDKLHSSSPNSEGFSIGTLRVLWNLCKRTNKGEGPGV